MERLKGDKRLFKHGSFYILIVLVFFTIMSARVNNLYAQPEIEEVDSDDAAIEIVEQTEDTIALEQSAKHGMWGTCVWEIDDESHLIVHPGIGQSQAGKKESPWSEYAKSITSVYFLEENGQRVRVSESTGFLFADFYNVADIDLSGLELNNVIDMQNMFESCVQLKFLNIPSFDTSHVENMTCMFYGCGNLLSVDVASWDVSQVKSMHRMFNQCTSLKSLDVSKWDTSNVRDLYMMFSTCSMLNKLDVSKWKTSNLIEVSYLFRGCSKLSVIDVSFWNTSSVKNMYCAFSGCNSITSIDISSFDLSNISTMEDMFRNCTNLKNIALNAKNTSNITSLCGMFSDCTSLTSVDMHNWNLVNVKDSSYMFYKCMSLETVNFGKANFAQTNNMDSMFMGCSSLQSLDATEWVTSQVQTSSDMLAGCLSLEMFAVGKDYVMRGTGMVPVATSIEGKWWSKGTGNWYSSSEIMKNRSGIPDVYYSYNVDDGGTSIGTATIKLDKDVYGWTGNEVQPIVSVTLDKTTLKKDIDYIVAYRNNVNDGFGEVTITGINKYKDSKKVKFEISHSAYFRDVNKNTYHVEDIIWLANAGITTGWKVGEDVYEFRPSQPVTRADMASFLYRLARKWGLVDDSWRATVSTMNKFVDVSSTTTAHYRAIWWLASVGITEGWPIERTTKSRFRPYASVARQDMAAFLFRLAKVAGRGGATKNWVASEAAKNMFADVDAKVSTNHHTEVWWLAQTGISKGWSVGNKKEFRGLSPVARQDMAAFLYRMDCLQ